MTTSAEYHEQHATFEYPATLEKIKRVYNFNAPKRMVLDLGCGDGRLGAELVGMGHDVWGVDVHQGGLDKAGRAGLRTVRADLEGALPLDSETFDVILLLDTLEHLADQETVLKESRRLLKEDGILIVSYPNHFDLRNRLNMLFGGGIIHWAHRSFANAIPWSYGHVRFLLFKDLLRLLELNNLHAYTAQFNFMSGGVIPRRLTPAFLRSFLLKRWPQLLTGKYVVAVRKHPAKTRTNIYLAATPKDM